MTHVFTYLALIVALACAAPAAAQASSTLPETGGPLTFSVHFHRSICESFTGRVYLMFGAGPGEPRRGPSWFDTQPFFALDVTDWKPDEPLIFDDRAAAYPAPLSRLPAREFAVQAVMRRNLDSPTIGSAEGDAYSTTVRRKFDGAASGRIELVIDQIVPAAPLRETERIRIVEHKSDLLSSFHQRPIMLRAAVILPAGHEQSPDRRYPALYWIGGFGSDATEAYFMQNTWERAGFDDQIVRVVLDPSCYGGHHCFADSANNGPRGRSLVEEFIPHLESKFRLLSAPQGRFLSGHSSGGWSSLWLQIAYPDVFGGVWSIAPDPVAFTDFQRINLYEPNVNMYRDGEGKPRPLARQGDRVMIRYEDFARMEIPYGEGGQLRSFEWVFSPRDDDGLPRRLYDRATGGVDPVTADAWKKYDIRLILKERWTELAPKLAGKIHVFMGADDTFYLEGATRELKQSLEALGSDAVIEIVPGKDHSTIASSALRKRIDQDIVRVFESATERQ